MKISEHLEQAEYHLSIAASKLSNERGGRMPNKTLWLAPHVEFRNVVRAMFKIKNLKDKISHYEE